MRIFVSSVVYGMEEMRAAAVAAIRSLGHQPVVCEDFPVGPASPQVTCLQGVRSAEAVVVLLGGRYGTKQPGSGQSPTHEEFAEAQRTKPMFVFVQDAVDRDADQQALVSVANDWASGPYLAHFTTPDDLKAALIAGLHRWELDTVRASADSSDVVRRVTDLLPRNDRHSSSSPTLCLAIAGSPHQSVIRPSELEDESLSRWLSRESLFGDHAVLVQREGSESAVRGNGLWIEQRQGAVGLHEDGAVVLRIPIAQERGGFGGVIEEDLHALLHRGLLFAASILEHVDRTHRLSTIALTASISGGGYMAWRTRVEQARNPGSMTINVHQTGDEGGVMLSPPTRPRSALRHQADALAVDLLTLLRRQYTR